MASVPMHSFCSTHIGTKSTHPSHTLRSLRGVLFCIKCGAITTQQLKALAAPCRCSTAAYAPPHAKTSLKRLANGDLPHGVKFNDSLWSTIWLKAWDRMVDSSRSVGQQLVSDPF